jgi:hypothetical protein
MLFQEPQSSFHTTGHEGKCGFNKGVASLQHRFNRPKVHSATGRMTAHGLVYLFTENRLLSLTRFRYAPYRIAQRLPRRNME